MALDPLSSRADDAAALWIPEPTEGERLARLGLTRPLPLITVELVAHVYPTTGHGEMALYRVEQAGDEPTIKTLSTSPLGFVTAEYDVPDMASYWMRAVASATGWAGLVGLVSYFRTKADHARNDRPSAG